jgi:hypothetical protein
MHALSVSPFNGGSGTIGGREEGGSAETGAAVSVLTGAAVSVLECCVVLPFSCVMFSWLLRAALCCATL